MGKGGGVWVRRGSPGAKYFAGFPQDADHHELLQATRWPVDKGGLVVKSSQLARSAMV